jgi:hypothetical protein
MLVVTPVNFEGLQSHSLTLEVAQVQEESAFVSASPGHPVFFG